MPSLAKNKSKSLKPKKVALKNGHKNGTKNGIRVSAKTAVLKKAAKVIDKVIGKATGKAAGQLGKPEALLRTAREKVQDADHPVGGRRRTACGHCGHSSRIPGRSIYVPARSIY